jgi:molybdate-binding protein/DNA-binding XRE family transcriptional regulator
VPDPHRRSDDRLRLTRLSRGLSQGDLAQSAGVTRQAISGIESGRWSPSLDVALSLASALDSTVEQLFGSPAEPPPVRARVAASSGAGAAGNRLLLTEIAGDTVAFPLTGDHAMVAGFVPALATSSGTTGVAEPGTASPAAPEPGTASPGVAERIEARRIAPAGPTLALAGCDPALALLLGPLQRHDPAVDLLWWSTGNQAALELLEAGSVHAAAVHRGVDAPVRVGPGIEVVGFASWREGLAVHPRFAGSVGDLRDVVSKKLRIANREQGSEARRLLDSELNRLEIDRSLLAGYDTEAHGHLLAASAVASGFADAAIVTEPAALAHGLGFSAWQVEISELHIPRSLLGSTEVRALLDVLAGRELPAQLAALAGYDAEPCGRIVAA